MTLNTAGGQAWRLQPAVLACRRQGRKTMSPKPPWAAYLSNNDDLIFVIKPYFNKNKRTFIRLLVFSSC